MSTLTSAATSGAAGSVTAATPQAPGAPLASVAPGPGVSRVGKIDPRGQRFAATLTTVVFAVALIAAPSALAWALLLGQLGVFVSAVALGPSRSPYALLFKRLLKPRLGPPTELEDAAPPRFAQGVGLGFTVVALTAVAVGLQPLFLAAAGMALAAAFLNAAFSFCLGCEMYLLLKRVTLPESVRRAWAVVTDCAVH